MAQRLTKLSLLSKATRVGACFGVAAIGCLIVGSAISGEGVSDETQDPGQSTPVATVNQLLEFTPVPETAHQEQPQVVRPAQSVQALLQDIQTTPAQPEAAPAVSAARVVGASQVQGTWDFPDVASSELLQRASFSSPIEDGQPGDETPIRAHAMTTAQPSAHSTPSQMAQPMPSGQFPVASSRLRPQRQFNATQPLAAQPLPAQPMVTQPISTAANETIGATAEYSLANSNWRAFEQNLVDLFGKNLSVKSSEQGRRVSVVVPIGRSMMPMTLDRMNNSITFEGNPKMASSWKQTVQLLDRPVAEGSFVQSLVSVPATKKAGQVRQTAFAMLAPAKAQEGNIRVQEGGRFVDAVQLPGSSSIEVPAGQGVQGNVKITLLEDLNTIIISGDPEDVKIVKKLIDDLVNSADLSQPLQKVIPLNNELSSVLAPKLQEIYDQIYAPVNGPANIRDIQNPNALFVTGQQKSIDQIAKMASNFDTKPVVEDAPPAFETYQLKHISAVDAKTRVDLYFGQSAQNNLADASLNPASPVTTIADYRSNLLIVKANPTYQKEVKALIEKIDVETTGATDQVKVIALRNALATDLASVIQDAISGQLNNAGRSEIAGNQAQGAGGQNLGAGQQVDPNSSQIRSRALVFMTENGMLEGGVMFDVRITPDTNSNSLVVTASKKSMMLVEALIKELDRIPDAETLVKVFPVINGHASNLLETLQALFSGTTQGGQGQGQAQGQGNLANLPLQSFSAGDGASLINLRFGVDNRTNSIIASGPAGDLQVIEDLILRLDGEATGQRRTYVYRLQNASVLDVVEPVFQWLDERNTLVADNTTLGEDYEAQTAAFATVVPEAVSNSVIISARPEYIPEILEVIKRLDRRPPMVKVKVMMVEVDLSTLEELGVDLGFQDSLLFDRGIGTIGFPFNQQGIGNNSDATALGSRENLAAQALSNLGTGRVNTELGYGGLVLSAGNESINVLMRALKDKQCARVLSKPHIMTIENSQGRVQIGAQVPRVTDSTVNQFGNLQNTVSDVPVGIILEITPRVSPDGLISMEVDVTKSALGDEASGVVVAVGPDGTPVRSPQILETSAQTTVMARNGQTVVFSGLIQEQKSRFERGAPILSDLPVIGPLFKFQGDSTSRSELMIILTPYIVNGDEDLDMLNHDEMDRMHWCLCDVAEVYGNADYDGSRGEGAASQTFYPDLDPAGNRPFYREDDNPGLMPAPGRRNATLDQMMDVPSEPVPGLRYEEYQGNPQSRSTMPQQTAPERASRFKTASSRLRNAFRGSKNQISRTGSGNGVGRIPSEVAGNSSTQFPANGTGQPVRQASYRDNGGN